MTQPEAMKHDIWSRWIFILAATGSAVGLGNIWKFPYITGENGGGAFVFVYLLCILLVGVPIMVAEVLMGRRGRANPVVTFQKLAKEAKASPLWGLVGWVGILASFLILSFYSVVAGWGVDFIFVSASGQFQAVDANAIGDIFSNLLANPGQLIIWHSVFIVMTVVVVGLGVHGGLERAVRFLMPALLVLLGVLFVYALSLDSFQQGVEFLFWPDFSKLTGTSILIALGHAFFTLSLGMGSMMVYGSYMPYNASIGKTVLLVGFLDTLVALVAGMVIFAIVFANGLEPGAGPGLMFVTLPIAFGQIPMGLMVGTLFFVLVTFAAWTSSIALLEPGVAYFAEKGISRWAASAALGALCWVLGIGSLLSFSEWSGAEYQVFGMTIFDGLDWLTANIMLPLGGLLIAIFVGWVMKDYHVRRELAMVSEPVYLVWRVLIRIVAPIAVLAIFAQSMGWL